MPMRTFALTLLALLVAPASALAATPQWHVRTVATGGAAFLVASDARGDRRLVVADDRRRGATHVLELRVGSTRRTLATGRHGFEGVHIGHDGRDRLTVTWNVIPGRKGPRRAFAWTQAGGVQRIALSGNQSVSDAALSVAQDGSAVLALWRSDGIYVSRRAAGDDSFGAPVHLTGAADFQILAAGRVVAWTSKGHAFASVDLAAPQDLGPASDLAIAFTLAGRVVLAAHDANAIVAYELPAGASAFGAPQTLSDAAFTGVPALVARGETVFIAFSEGELGQTARDLSLVRWGQALAPKTTYDTGHDLGSRRALLRGQALPGTAARFYYRTVGNTTRWFTVWFDAAGRAHGAARVTPPGERQALDLTGQPAGSGSVAVWTTQVNRSSSGDRIRIATP
jgi:hypothetical protein